MPQEQENEEFSTIEVRVGTVPGSVKDYVLNGRRTVSDALSAAGLSATNYEIRVNMQLASLETDLDEGDTVLLVKKIKGNA
jgi:sulfur carrier protein ThiS